MTKLQVGDRVAVYTGHDRFTGTVTAFSKLGGVMVTEDGDYSNPNGVPYHAKQCRKIMKKELGRKRWLNPCFAEYRSLSVAGRLVFSDEPKPDWIELVEARRKR